VGHAVDGARIAGRNGDRWTLPGAHGVHAFHYAGAAGRDAGMWKRYYERWRQTTREKIDPHLLDLMPQLAQFAPPAVVIAKSRYSAFVKSQLHAHLMDRKADGLIVTGSERRLRAGDGARRSRPWLSVIVVRDAICSSSDEGHDALLRSITADTPNRSRSRMRRACCDDGDSGLSPPDLG